MTLSRLHAAAFLSGAAALVYQILWVRRLGDALGHGHLAVAIVLATFFLGLGVGARLLGRSADRSAHPVRLYVALELSIGAWGLAFPWLAAIAENAYFALAPIDLGAGARLASRTIVAVLLLAPPCVALGGTLPVLVRLAAPSDRAIGRAVGRLYGWNTLGAAFGCFATAFVLLPSAGFTGALGLAAVANVAAAALVWSRRVAVAPPPSGPPLAAPAGSPMLLLLAGLSGFVGIAYEIVWTRALAARLSSTVYTFAILLGTFLAALAFGSFAIARRDARRRVTADDVALLLIATAIAGVISTWLIDMFGESIRRGAGNDLRAVQASELLTAALIMVGPCLCLGATFPALVRLAHGGRRGLGVDLGRVYLANTVGAVGAALITGFIALPAIGLTATVVACAVSCALAGLLVLPRAAGGVFAAARRHAVLGGAFVLATAVFTTDLRHWRSHARDQLVDYREGAAASVAVVRERAGNLILKVDRTYRLGGERGRYPQQREGLVPLLLHPDPQRVLMIGLGTGCSAGAAAAWDDGIELDAVEIVPEVADVVGHFDAISEGFAERVARDPGVRIWRGVDARHFVRATRRRYDVVIGDLFVPWRPGEGAMYTVEHFEAVRDVLADGGLFVQWLPLYQLGPSELRTIVATFDAAFPETVAFWQYFNVRTPSIGLVGSATPLRLDPESLTAAFAGDRRRALLAAVNLDGPADVVALWCAGGGILRRFAENVPIETLLRPRTEFAAAHHQTASGAGLARSCLRALLPLQSDVAASSWLAGADPGQVRTGVARHAAVRALWDGQIALRLDDDLESAIEPFGAALVADPTWDWVAGRLERVADAALLRNEHETAARAAIQLFRVEAQSWRGHWIAARIAYAQDDPERALRAAREALRLNPDHASSRAMIDRLTGG